MTSGGTPSLRRMSPTGRPHSELIGTAPVPHTELTLVGGRGHRLLKPDVRATLSTAFIPRFELLLELPLEVPLLYLQSSIRLVESHFPLETDGEHRERGMNA